MGTSYPQSENENSNFLAKLWQDSIAEYRRTVQPNKINEGVLREPLSVDAQLLTVTSDWDVFRDRNTASTSKTLNRVGNVIHDVLLSLHQKISALDVLIALPTVAVHKLSRSTADVEYRYFHQAQQSGQHFGYFYRLPTIGRQPTA
jgi:hypothetical protein